MSDFTINFPIEMIKKEQRIVSGIATADNVDKAGDLINFQASLEAFKNWEGNIREMHAPIAVGKAIKYEPVEIQGEDGKKYNAIRVDAYISKGAEDTWQKVLDGTLRAFSVGGKIVEKEQLANKSFNGRPVNHIKKYVLGELSLVDNPGNAVAVIDIVKRANNGELDYILKIDCADIDLSIPESVQNAARIGLEQRKKEGRGGTSVGYGSARRLAAGGQASEAFVRKVARYFPRHEVDKQGKGWNPGEDNYPSNGRIAWNLWGGDAGWAWARAKVKQLDNCTTRKFESTDCSCGCNSCEEINKEAAPSGVSVTTENATSKNPTQGSFKTPKNPKAKKPKSYMFKTKEEAMKKAKDLGCEGFQEIVVNGTTMYRACSDTGAYIGAISKDIASSFEEELVMQKDARTDLVDTLSTVISNNIVLYFVAHRAHWNVEGPDFHEYHGLFGEIYEDAYGAIDTFAENIRKLGGFPPSLSEAEDTASYEDDSASSNARALASDLYIKNSQFIGMLKAAFEVANMANEQGIANFIAERIDMHEKWDWQLHASLMAEGMPIPSAESEEEDDEQEDDMEQPEPTSDEIAQMIREMFAQSVAKAAPKKTENGEQFPASAYAYVPDPSMPSTWKIRLWETNSSKETAAQVGRAVAAIGAGFRGNKADIPADSMASVKAKILRAWRKTHPGAKSEDIPAILKYDTNADLVKMQADLLQNHEIYDTLSRIDEMSEKKLSLLKRFVNWLTPENETNASTISVEVENDQVEEEMDVNILKEALGNVIDEKLTEFSTSIKAEIEASVNEKLETITKGFEVQTTELQEKLQVAEQALAEQTEKVEAFASAGAIKKSVDPEDDGEEVELKKSAPKSVWNNIYLPQDLIESMGYES